MFLRLTSAADLEGRRACIKEHVTSCDVGLGTRVLLLGTISYFTRRKNSDVIDR